MVTTYLVGNLSLNDNTRINDYLLTQPDDNIQRPSTYKMPVNLYSKDLMMPDNHTSFVCIDDEHDYYSKNQMNLKIKSVESTVKAYTDHVIPDHFVATIE